MFDNMEFENEFDWDDQDRLAVEAYQLYEEGQMHLALSQVDKALEINPTSDSLNFNKALILDAIGKFEEAIVFYKVALESRPNDPEIYNSLAVDYTRTGMYDMAVSTFQQALEIDSEFEPAYCNSIITYTEMGKYDKAEESFYMAQQLNPECALCFYNIGNSLFCRGEIARALWCWEKTKHLDFEHPNIDYRIAQAHWAMGNTNCANESFLTELRRDAGNIEVLLDYALFLIQSKNYVSAREKLNRIIELDPQFAQAYQYLGELELNAGNPGEAEKCFRRSLSVDKIVGPNYRLGQIEFERGNKDKAIMHFRHELNMEVEDFDVLMSMGTMLLKSDEHDLSTQCFLQATDQEPGNAEPFYYMGLCMYKAGESLDAEHFFSYAVDLDSGEQRSNLMLIKCYIENGQFDLAGDRICTAIEMGGDVKDLLMMKRYLGYKKIESKVLGFCNAVKAKLKKIRKSKS